MARTPGTRVGKGAGHGGPAQGAGQGAGWGGPARGGEDKPAEPFTADDADRHRPDFSKMARDEQGRILPAERTRLRQEAADEAFAHLMKLLRDPATPPQVTATCATAVLNRVEGMPTARQEHTGADGAPLITGLHVSFVDPDDAATED